MTSIFTSFFFLNDPATTEIYTLSLPDALRICEGAAARRARRRNGVARLLGGQPPRSGAHPRAHGAQPGRQSAEGAGDRKSTRLNSSHGYISYAVFCLKKKKQTNPHSAHESPMH